MVKAQAQSALKWEGRAENDDVLQRPVGSQAAPSKKGTCGMLQPAADRQLGKAVSPQLRDI